MAIDLCTSIGFHSDCIGIWGLPDLVFPPLTAYPTAGLLWHFCKRSAPFSKGGVMSQENLCDTLHYFCH